MAENPSGSPSTFEVPTVKDKAKRPTGVLPKNVQTMVIVGVAAMMIAILALQGPADRKVKSGHEASETAAVDPNQHRIQEYRNRIEEHARKLAAERARLEQAQQSLTGFEGSGGETILSAPEEQLYETHPPRPSNRQKSAIEQDKKERKYRSLFASNVALTYRTGEERVPTAQPPSSDPVHGVIDLGAFNPYVFPYPSPINPSFPSLGDQTSPSLIPTPPSLSSSQESYAGDPKVKGESATREGGLNRATGKKYRLFEGTVLEAVLTNRLAGSFSGPVNCMLTTDVYSHDRQHLLIPKGSRILGEVRQVDHFGQERLAVFFHRLIMPDGYSLDLDRFQGLNQIGETGLKDKVDRHYFRIFGASLAIGALGGLAQAGTRYGFDVSAEDAYRQGVSRSLSQSSIRVLDRFLNILPTFTIREGHRIKIYLSNDLLIPAYENHQLEGDL